MKTIGLLLLYVTLGYSMAQVVQRFIYSKKSLSKVEQSESFTPISKPNEFKTKRLTPGRPFNRPLAEMARLTIRVPGYLEGAYQGFLKFHLRALNSDTSIKSFGRRRQIPNYLGGDFLQYLEPGRYRLRANYATLKGYSECEYWRQEFDLIAGENSIEVPLPALCSVKIRFPEKYHGSYLNLTSDSDWNYPSSNARSQITWILTAGIYHLKVGSNKMSFRVSNDPQLEQNFASTHYRCCRIHHVKPGSYLEQLGLINGDLVVKINGEQFVTTNPHRFIYDYWKTHDLLPLEVIRDGQRITITVEKRMLVHEMVHLYGTLAPE